MKNKKALLCRAYKRFDEIQYLHRFRASCDLFFYVFFWGFRFGLYYLNNMGEHISISKYRLCDLFISDVVYRRIATSINPLENKFPIYHSPTSTPRRVSIIYYYDADSVFFIPLNSSDINSAFIDS